MKRLDVFLDKPEGEKVTLVKKPLTECISSNFKLTLEQLGEW